MTGSSSGFDARRFKALERQGYTLIAVRYEQAASRRAALHAALLDAANLSPGQAVLDVASGPAVLAQAASSRVLPGMIVASDFAEQILMPAQAACPSLMFAAADAEALPFADAVFDRIVCGLGLMFFPDEQQALAEMRRVLKTQGVVALSVWGRAQEVPLIECALACMRRMLPAPKVPRRSVFHLGSPAHLGSILRSAGFIGITIKPFQLEYRFASADEYWQAFLDLAGGAAASLARLPTSTQASLSVQVALELAPYEIPDGGYQLTSKVLIASATKPERSVEALIDPIASRLALP